MLYSLDEAVERAHVPVSVTALYNERYHFVFGFGIEAPDNRQFWASMIIARKWYINERQRLLTEQRSGL